MWKLTYGQAENFIFHGNQFPDKNNKSVNHQRYFGLDDKQLNENMEYNTSMIKII